MLRRNQKAHQGKRLRIPAESACPGRLMAGAGAKPIR